ncbi:MAG: TetR family transcriptional regulator [Bacteroidetes bacterium]|jgi:AcrR family transcriptional regulator|nr:TetR family transcriptional regulator [Bacteroidota bacterium]
MSRNARKTEILRTAAGVFREKGFHGARIQDVADRLGMQKGSLYYYISSKEDLLRGLVEEPIRAMNQEVRELLDTGYAPAQKLARVIELHLRYFQEHRDIFGIFLREDIELLDQTSDSDLRALLRTYEDYWDELLQEGIADGVFREDIDRSVITKAVIGMCNGTFTWFNPDGRYPIQEIARLLADFALRGVCREESVPSERIASP